LWSSLTAPWQTTIPQKIYEPVGCLVCRETGFKGRQGIYEMMPYTETLHAFAGAVDDLPNLKRQAYKEGMCSLRLSGAQKVANGMTSVLEVLRVAPESQR
jgi:general secretion pathway protein E